MAKSTLSGKVEPTLRNIEDAIPTRSIPNFDPPAEDAFFLLVGEYVKKLGLRSCERASSERVDSVSRRHVDEAARELGQTDARHTLVNSLGGVLLGAAISGLISLMLVSSAPDWLYVVVFAMGVVGASMLSMASWWPSRL